MNIILFTKNSKKPACYNVSRRQIVTLLVLVLVMIPVLVMYAGYQFGKLRTQHQLFPKDWEVQLQQQKKEIADASQKARESMNALAVRLGQIQAQSIRLNALGKRLVEVAKLDKGEFNFSNPSPQGGPGDTDLPEQQIDIPDFLQSLDKLAAQLDDREQQLRVMESFYMDSSLQKEIIPSGRPIKGGWISSYFGLRTDPFNGLQERHEGFDFAGKLGSDVYAVASGVVTWAGDRYGYGNMVEINHGNGYATRYAHDQKVLVKVGDTVKKGERVALMGSTGRSTGPHVHFEVLYRGRPIDPAKFVYAAR
jgi:murein DD-endopeptidase MepM/ murein hydrolase activator NlpD